MLQRPPTDLTAALMAFGMTTAACQSNLSQQLDDDDGAEAAGEASASPSGDGELPEPGDPEENDPPADAVRDASVGPEPAGDAGASNAGTDAGAPDPCGNGRLDPGEHCDDGMASESCNSDCTFVQCGDGVRNSKAGEQCDDGGQSSLCNADCTRFVCPPDCSCAFRGGSTYWFCSEELSQEAAQMQCRELGGALAEIETDKENRFLFAQSDNLSVQLAGNDRDAEGRWVWPSAGTFYADGQVVPPLIAPWADGEPDNDNDNQHCVHIAANGASSEWRDGNCDFARPYLCERTRLSLLTCGDGVKDEGEMCDTGAGSATCDPDCTAPVCGDGLLNVVAGEACDDNNKFDLDACDENCQPTGLLSQWPLTEARGVLARDRIGEHDLTPFNFELSAGDGGGLALDGVDDYLTLENVSNPPEFDFTGEFSIAAKVQFEAVPAGVRPIVVHGESATTSHLGLWLRGETLQAGINEFTEQGNRSEIVQFDVLDWVGDGRWHHLAVTLTDQQWSLYIDAIQVNLWSQPEGAAPIDARWYVGGFPPEQGDTFHGSIKDVRIYDRGLEPGEVTALSNLP